MSETKPVRAVREYVACLFEAGSWKVFLTLGLIVALSLTEGIGLLMLIPLLQLVDIQLDPDGSVGRIAQYVSTAFGRLGIPLTLISVLTVYVLIIAVHGLLSRWQTTTGFTLQREFIVYLRKRLYRAIVSTNWVFFSRKRISDFTHVLTSEVDRIGVATYHLLHMTATGIVALVYVLLAIKISAVMTVVAFLCGSALLIVLGRKIRISRRAGRDLTESTRALYASISEHLGGIKTAKSYGAEMRHTEIFGRLSEEVRDQFVIAIRNQAEVRYWFDVGAVIALSVVLYISRTYLALDTASLLLLLFLFGRILPRFSAIQQDLMGFVNYIPAWSAATEQESLCLGAAETEPESNEPIEFRSAVRLASVDFSYQDTPTLSEINLEIPAGRTAAIVGPSGSGKSTLADIVIGLIEPANGRVTIDGVPLTPERLRAWRDRIGYVAQDTFLFHDTIRANLVWAHREATEDDLWEALRLASAEVFVKALAEGLDTIVGDRGVRLSGGERQRLALARALLRKPALLILDEATSNLDSENEQRILRAIDDLHGSITILLISHRLATVRHADLIHVLDEGRLVESGMWGELANRTGGRFQALCIAQGIDVNGGAAANQRKEQQ